MSLISSYLILYNLTQLIGVLVVIITILRFNVEHGKDSDWTHFPIAGSFAIAEPVMKIVLWLQALEVLHSLVGISRGSPVASVIQVGFKTFIFYALMVTEPGVQNNRSAGLLLLVWCLADSLRYPFYLLSLMKRSVYLITWIRYSAWVLLYPVGITLEAVVAYQNLNFLSKSGRLSYQLPNQLNISFDIVTFLRIYLYFGIFIGSYSMLSYMWGQRKRVLRSS